MVPTHGDPIDLLRAHGLRVTSQRLTIIRALMDRTGHPTAEEVLTEVRADHPTLSRSTVYDTLSRFVDLGLVGELHTGEGVTRYEFSEDPHINLVCTACGSIQDAQVDALTALVEQLAEETTYQVPEQMVELHGVCQGCRDNG